MKWTFANNDGGRDSGFHDAGVETFKGNFDRYLAREIIQNSLDARYDRNKPVHVKFEVLKLKRGDIPDMTGLKATFQRCGEYWEHQPKAAQFFERAEKLAGGKFVVALRIGDYNTTGVCGADNDRQNNWYNLIRCAGSSSKSGDEGGSFGIGKNAPFAASQMRTVLYSTYNKDKEHVFQGVAMLVSHALPNGSKAQPTGYLGGKNGESLRKKAEIPPRFLRKELGTDIIVLGFPDGVNWKKDLTYSILENFWPAIDNRDLIVTVGEQRITSENLPELLERFSSDEEFSAHQYYKAFKEPTYPFHENLPRLKDVSLYLLAGDGDLQKRVAMVRKTGMVIFAKQFRSVMPFCGVFLCRNETGNKLLRDMEPPRHDIWDPDHPEKGANRTIESEYTHFIRQSVKSLLPVDDSKVISVPGLNRFLPDDDESPEEEFDGVGEHAKRETADRSPLPEKIQGKKIETRHTAMQPDNKQSGEGEDITEEGGGGGGDAGGGGGEGGDGVGKGKGQLMKGAAGGEQSKPVIPVRYRTFATNLSAGVYVLTVAPEQKTAKAATLAIWTVGDDQRVPADIRSARLADGREVGVKGPGLLGPIVLPRTGALHVEVKLGEPLRVAMEVAAHEA